MPWQIHHTLKTALYGSAINTCLTGRGRLYFSLIFHFNLTYSIELLDLFLYSLRRKTMEEMDWVEEVNNVAVTVKLGRADEDGGTAGNKTVMHIK